MLKLVLISNTLFTRDQRKILIVRLDSVNAEMRQHEPTCVVRCADAAIS